MAWRYCDCGQGLDMPDVKEACQGFQVCPVCDEQVDVPEDERRGFLLKLHERTERLEKQVKGLIDITRKVALAQKTTRQIARGEIKR